MPINSPWIINTDTLEQQLATNNVIVVDMGSKDSYSLQHIPGARFIDYNTIVKNQTPIMGMLPDNAQLSKALSNVSIRPDDYVVAYDNEGSGRASRLLWTLEIAGHEKLSLLDGGIDHWLQQNKAVSHTIPEYSVSHYVTKLDNMHGVATTDYILSQLSNAQVKILDVRSAGEFNGVDIRANRAGHIPGAVNIDWLRLKDPGTQKLLEQNSLMRLLEKNGITPDKEIIVHCHSHHRSALAYVALKNLGYAAVKGYPGSWSEWATRTDTPIES